VEQGIKKDNVTSTLLNVCIHSFISIIPSLLISIKSKMSLMIENPGFGSLAYWLSLRIKLLN